MTSPHTANAAVTEPVDAAQGIAAEASDPAAFRHALDLALHYRGDVTLRLTSSGESIEGYIFDVKTAVNGSPEKVRIVPRDGTPRRTVPVSSVARIEFTGKDAAAGKSFETWVKKYVQKKLAGEAANIESEPLVDA